MLVGDESGAEAALASGGADTATANVQLALFKAMALGQSGSWVQAGAVYRQAVVALQALPSPSPAHRTAAIVSNNLATEILEQADAGRGDADLAGLMLEAAENSRAFWSLVGTWVNAMRGDYLVSLVLTATGNPRGGLASAERGLAAISSNTLPDAPNEHAVDTAFLLLAQGAACRDLGSSDRHADSLTAAKALAEGFDRGTREWFESELAKAA